MDRQLPSQRGGGWVNSAFEKLFGDLVKRGFNKIDYLKFA